MSAAGLGTHSVPLRTAVLVLTLIGFGLRLAAAHDDLWLDEIWTFRLLEGVSSFWSIFFALPNDNNHVLNTAWLAAVGPDASPMLVRLPAVVFGTLSIPVAGRIGARRGASAALFGAAAVSFGMIFVEYGSEARGYAGMILAMLLAVDGTEVYLDNDARRRKTLLIVGIAIAFGTLSQLTMVATSFALGLTVAIRVFARDGWSNEGRRRIERFAGAVARGSLPAFVCVVVSAASTTPQVGVRSPFSWQTFATGLGRAFEATLGLPDSQNILVSTIVTTSTLALAAVALALVPRNNRVFPSIAIFGVPALHVLLRVPNEQFARFHLITSLGLLILAIDATGVAARAGKLTQHLAVACLALWGVGQAFNLSRLIEDGRGSFRAPVAVITGDDPATVYVQPAVIAGETLSVANWYATKQGRRIVRAGSPCSGATQWLLLVREPGDLRTTAQKEVSGPEGCRARFAFQSAYPAYGLSGFVWQLFKYENTTTP